MTRAACLLLLALCACAGRPPERPPGAPAALAACPDTPNCVSSDATRESQRVAPLRFEGDPAVAWRRALAAVASLPRTRILREEAGYVHAECTSALMRYRDDLELELRADRGEIAVRSASRIGYSDMGANRARVEALREAFDAAAP